MNSISFFKSYDLGLLEGQYSLKVEIVGEYDYKYTLVPLKPCNEQIEE